MARIGVLRQVEGNRERGQTKEPPMHIARIALIATLAFGPAAFADETPSAMLEKGIFQEETAGNLDAAVKVYKQIVDEANANRRFVSRRASLRKL